ncbi:probable Putative adenylate kinase FAP7 [Saccharomycodes ludwigii]|uniref:Adenylate kinase isoenzyme 6 homolog n=1 Tax=Saccharomycodes ludwigii TaxID=36035 RepID=A0A376B901_9ASCO|nr:hypothetical protein SCDLUD_000229 [Saccharomycodes ludwigii]KAH3902648.1 hypothetical protein SCDLUD_000229 [Saccharomycodes ludwigii]SSD61049.1 probable Putative adenylate kinase FAP7 [Saccharomycodes ludwigii]
MSLKRRFRPNIIITGTPGCGKSTTCELLMRKLESDNYNKDAEYSYFNISEYAKENKLLEGYDESRKSHIIDEDKLLDELEPLMRQGGCIIDWHCNDIFPERLIDLVVVLRCDNGKLYDRLNKRGYHLSKIQENLDAEIMGIVYQDALDSYVQEIIIELSSDSIQEMESNVERVAEWLNLWCNQHKDGITNELKEFQKLRKEKETSDTEDSIE